MCNTSYNWHGTQAVKGNPSYLDQGLVRTLRAKTLFPALQNPAVQEEVDITSPKDSDISGYIQGDKWGKKLNLYWSLCFDKNLF